MFYDSSDYNEAITYFNKGLSIRLQTLGEQHISTADFYFNIGNCLFKLKEYYDAIQFFSKGYQCNPKGGYQFRIATCYEFLEKKESALNCFIKSAELRRDDPEAGLESDLTKESISNSKRLANDIGKEIELPIWIKNYEIIANIS